VVISIGMDRKPFGTIRARGVQARPALKREPGGLHGDKSASVVPDLSRLKRFVPGFVAARP